MVDRGADLAWISQYPHEQEYLFAPLTGIDVQSIHEEGELTVVQVRLNVNLQALTLEEVATKMQRSHTDFIKLLIDDLKFAKVPERAWRSLLWLKRDMESSVEPDW